MIITNVRGTLKAGCDVELTQRTVICGPNGSGKSTIVQSVELATTGNVSDFESFVRNAWPLELAFVFSAFVFIGPGKHKLA